VGDGEKLFTYLNSALKALLGFDIFPRGTKKSEIFLPSVISRDKTHIEIFCCHQNCYCFDSPERYMAKHESFFLCTVSPEDISSYY
jgi:hypothetical protein